MNAKIRRLVRALTLESSTDDGKTWKVVFDGTYVRAAAKRD